MTSRRYARLERPLRSKTLCDCEVLEVTHQFRDRARAGTESYVDPRGAQPGPFGRSDEAGDNSIGLDFQKQAAHRVGRLPSIGVKNHGSAGAVEDHDPVAFCEERA